MRVVVGGGRVGGHMLWPTGRRGRRRHRENRPSRQDRTGNCGHRGSPGRDGRVAVPEQRRTPPVPVLVDEAGPDHRARRRAQQRQVQIRGAHRHALHQGTSVYGRS